MKGVKCLRPCPRLITSPSQPPRGGGAEEKGLKIKVMKAVKLYGSLLLAVLMSVVAFLVFRSFIIDVDPEAALYDLGKLEDITYGVMKFWVLAFTAIIATLVLFPILLFVKSFFYINSPTTLSSCTRLKFYLQAYFVFLLALVLLAM
jgi:hypothetical protein